MVCGCKEILLSAILVLHCLLNSVFFFFWNLAAVLDHLPVQYVTSHGYLTCLCNISHHSHICLICGEIYLLLCCLRFTSSVPYESRGYFRGFCVTHIGLVVIFWLEPCCSWSLVMCFWDKMLCTLWLVMYVSWIKCIYASAQFSVYNSFSCQQASQVISRASSCRWEGRRAWVEVRLCQGRRGYFC